MLKSILLPMIVGVTVACAGERKSTSVVSSSGDVVATIPYTLVFSAISTPAGASPLTSVTVRLKAGSVTVTSGDAAKAKVELKYRDRSSAFVPFPQGGLRKLNRGTTTFRVQLASSDAHQLRAETVIEEEEIWAESGIFSVLHTDEEEQDTIENRD